MTAIVTGHVAVGIYRLSGRRDDSSFPIAVRGIQPDRMHGCEIRADADGVRGVPVVGIAIVVDVAEVRRRLNNIKSHPLLCALVLSSVF